VYADIYNSAKVMASNIQFQKKLLMRKISNDGIADMQGISQRNGKCSTWDRFISICKKIKAQDTWFLLKISAILKSHLYCLLIESMQQMP
jgi:hypothetical protein